MTSLIRYDAMCPIIANSRPSPIGFVYLMAIKGSQPPVVKIGWALDPQERLKALQTGNDREIILVSMISGTRRDESAMHYAFKPLRLGGEWFVDSSRMEIRKMFLDIESEIYGEQLRKSAMSRLQHADALQAFRDVREEQAEVA